MSHPHLARAVARPDARDETERGAVASLIASASSSNAIAARIGPNTSSCARRCVIGTSRNSIGAW
jgi:anti-sigma factor RsiW